MLQPPVPSVGGPVLVADVPGVESAKSSDSDVILEGWLEKKPKHGVKGLRAWKKKYFVLMRSSRELRYYSSMVCLCCWYRLLFISCLQRVPRAGSVAIWPCTYGRAWLHPSRVCQDLLHAHTREK